MAVAPVFGTSLLLIGSFTPTEGEDGFNWPMHFAFFGLWLLLLSLFAVAYMATPRWLQRRGIYQSWSNFEAYVKENHRHPSISEEEETDFFSWAGLPEERPAGSTKPCGLCMTESGPKSIPKSKESHGALIRWWRGG